MVSFLHVSPYFRWRIHSDQHRAIPEKDQEGVYGTYGIAQQHTVTSVGMVGVELQSYILLSNKSTVQQYTNRSLCVVHVQNGTRLSMSLFIAPYLTSTTLCLYNRLGTSNQVKHQPSIASRTNSAASSTASECVNLFDCWSIARIAMSAQRGEYGAPAS